jgi:hypothetical protein
MRMNNKIYDVFKWGLMIFIPAVITLLGTLGKIYKFDTETIILTISAIATFIGAITGISNINYNKVDYTSDTVGEEIYEEESDK